MTLRSIVLPALALALAACAKPADPAPEAPAPPTADAPAPSAPDVPPDEAASPGSAAWTVRPDGYGPLRVGMTPAEATAAAGQPVRYTPQSEGSTCGYATLDSATARHAWVMFNEGTLARVDVHSASTVRTPEGIGLGSTEAALEAAYPGLRRAPGKYVPDGEDLTVMAPGDTTRRYVFQTSPEGLVTSYRGGRMTEVTWIEGCS